MAKIEIRKNGLDKYQVWKDNLVLHPDNLSWEPSYLSNLEHMWFSSVKKAEKAMVNTLAKEDVEVYRVYETK